MTELNQIYRCNVCGNIVEMVHASAGQLVCCGQPMELLVEKTEDEGKEKHVPVIERTDEGIIVKIGSVPHPMEESHYIEWVEILHKGRTCKKFLNPGESPEVKFRAKSEDIKVREYCSVHGLWVS
ncbi:MAG: desulfoferrodoxin [Actinomycetia bacterium]|nr:desulfoferrodoxin [Actinomycetes bacterium]